MVTPNRGMTEDKKKVLVTEYYEDCVRATMNAVQFAACPCKGCQIAMMAELAMGFVAAGLVREVRDGKTDLMDDVRAFVKTMREKYPLNPVCEKVGDKPT